MFNFSGNVRINGETEMTERKAFLCARTGAYIEIKGREIIVVGDGVEQPYLSMCRDEGVTFLSTGIHSGKRKAMALGASKDFVAT